MSKNVRAIGNPEKNQKSVKKTPEQQVDVEMDPPILIMKNKTNETWLSQNTSKDGHINIQIILIVHYQVELTRKS